MKQPPDLNITHLHIYSFRPAKSFTANSLIDATPKTNKTFKYAGIRHWILLNIILIIQHIKVKNFNRKYTKSTEEILDVASAREVTILTHGIISSPLFAVKKVLEVSANGQRLSTNFNELSQTIPNTSTYILELCFVYTNPLLYNYHHCRESFSRYDFTR